MSKDISNSELITGSRRSSRRLIEDMPNQTEVCEPEVQKEEENKATLMRRTSGNLVKNSNEKKQQENRDITNINVSSDEEKTKKREKK